MEELIAKRYVKALLESGLSDRIETAIADLKGVATALEEPKVQELVENPLVPARRKYELLVAPIKDSLEPRIARTLELLSEKGRLNLVPAIVKILELEQRRSLNRFEGTVESEERLDEEALKKLADTLGRYSGAEVTLKQTREGVDGLRAEVEDLGLELSFSKSRLKEELLEYIQRAL